MVVNGRVHSFGSIYVGTTASLTFNSGVSASGTLTAPLVDGLTSGWTPGTPTTWNTKFNPDFGYLTNVNGFSSLPLDKHYIIEIPPAGENSMSVTGIHRLYNQAQMVLIVTNNYITGSITNPTVQLKLQYSPNGQVPGADPSPVILTYTNAWPYILSTNWPFLSLTNRFFDQREYKTNNVTQIDVRSFAVWANTNGLVQGKLPGAANVYPTILYVADRRVNAKELAVVRLVNGAQLPDNNGLGFTVATPNPLYVQGNYNVQTASSATNASAGTSNTTYTVPAALISDALTVLSSHWSDAVSFTSKYTTGNASYAATTTNTINAAIITGTVASTGTSGTTFSGGVHNLPRLLEDWSGTHLFLNTSIIRLWNSQLATNQFRNPGGFSPTPVNPYYNPPTRHFNFDTNFLNPNKIPPGTPVFGISQ